MSAADDGLTNKSVWYVGRLFWINGELYVVTKVGEAKEGRHFIPMDVEKVEFDDEPDA